MKGVLVIDKIYNSRISNELSFADQIYLLMSNDIDTFLKRSARFDDTWDLFSDKSLCFKGGDYKVLEFNQLKKKIGISRLSFLGLDGLLPWTFINSNLNFKDDILGNWIDVLNKRFWELDVLAKSVTSNARFLLHNAQASKMIGSVIRQFSKTSSLHMTNKGNISQFIDENNGFKGYDLSVNENLIKVRISKKNHTLISGMKHLGERCSIGSSIPMKLGSIYNIKLNNLNDIRNNSTYMSTIVSKIKDRINLIAEVKFGLKGFNRINVKFPGEPEDGCLGTRYCILGKYAHLSSHSNLSISYVL